jgi:hypothetical protein
MQEEVGVSTAQKNAKPKHSLMDNGFNVVIAEKKFIELLEILKNLKVRNFFARKIAIAHGRMKIVVAVKMRQIG